MYLYDYQRHQINKIRRGGNYIIQGSRQVGITSILVNYSLLRASEDYNSKVYYFINRFDIIKYIERTVSDILYSAKTGAVSIFDRNLNIKEINASSSGSSGIKFSNGSEIKILTPAHLSVPGQYISPDLIIVDNANMMNEIEINNIFRSINSPTKPQIIFGFTGPFFKNKYLYELYLSSLRGEENYEYIRLPWELSVKSEKKEEFINIHEPTTAWLHDFELLSVNS
jgi:hypothetical protein